jgi:uncharacterized membrane protein YhaH (DUF805 family)
MLNRFRRWADPTVPAGQAGFTVIQVVGFILEGPLRRWIWAADARTKGLLLVCAMAMFAIMATATAKRLLDVGWPRLWSGSILGVVLLHILNATRTRSSVLADFSVALFIGYLALVVVLAFRKRRVSRVAHG